MKKLLSLLFALGLTLSACGMASPQSTPPARTSTPTLTPTATQTSTPNITPLPTIPTFPSTLDFLATHTTTPAFQNFSNRISISCDNWQKWPVIPSVGKTSFDVYTRGLTAGNNPRAFSKIGGGEISSAWFLSTFDLDDSHYNLGEHEELSMTIEYFRGSFERSGIAAARGYNTRLILDSRATKNLPLCSSDESPLDCEIRVHRPSFAIISLGTNQAWKPKEFEIGLRKILDILITKGVLPILSTKGDNLEGDHRINRTIACLAQEYDLPLWNFWLAIQPLSNHGLQPDLEHLTYYGINDFGNKNAMQHAWTIRNLTALQVLEAIWQGISN